MHRYLIFLLTLSLFSSCKTQYANFQESSRPSIQAKPKKSLALAVNKIVAKEKVFLEKTKEPKVVQVEFNKVVLPIIIAPERSESLVETENIHYEKPEAKFFNPKQNQKEKPKKKKKGKKFRQISSNLFVGFIFLGIAIVLAFLKLPTLVLLFGLASIIFLAIGLKKIWKKKRRQNRFKNIFKKK
jgi:hypothetical protein